jgi:F-type H+-transporting ATPase subunit a
LFILVANWLGLIPGIGSIGIEHHGEETLIPLLRAPNADLNTTLGLAIISLVATQYVGFKHLGLKYLKKFFNFSAPPETKGLVRLVLVVANGFAGLLELVAELIKIFSFAFRLFGNAFAGEVLLMVISFLASFIIVIPFLGLELFVGLVQALIFAMLSLIFFRMAIHHH